MVTEKIPEGYKQTEVGVIPEDWGLQNILDNSTLKARIGWQGLTTAEYLDSGKHYLITGTDFVDGEINWDVCNFVDENRYIQDKNIQIKRGDVLVTKDGTIGKIAYIHNFHGEATLNSGIFVIRPKQQEYIPLFLYYLLQSFYFDAFLTKLKAGSTISHLYQKDFSNFNFVVPPLPEQTAIATALSNIDSLMTSLDKLIAKKRNIKQGAMQELLTGRRRLPGFSGEWFTDQIKNLAFITTGSKNTQDKSDEGVYPFFVRSQIVERIKSYSYEGEAVLTAGDGVGTGKVYHYINGKFDFHQRVYKISDFRPNLDGYFFFLYFSNNFLDRIMQMTAKSSVDSVRMEMIADMPIPLPPLVEQQAIAKILTDMEDEIISLENKRDKYVAIKQGMMQQLLTGKIRLI